MHVGRRFAGFLLLAWVLILAACSSSGEVIEPTPPTTPHPLDAETAVEVEVTKAPDPVPLEGSEWRLISLHGASLVDGSAITLGFFPENYLEGDAGCDSYGADYAASGSDFRIHQIHRTQLDCDLPASLSSQEDAFFEALPQVIAYRAAGDVLEFLDNSGQTVLTFARKVPPAVDLALQDTGWALTQLQGGAPLEGSHLSLDLGPEGFSGFTGCNRYGGEYAAASDGEFRTPEIWQTEMECPTPALMEQEQAYLGLLQGIVAYQLVEDGLELVDATGEMLLAYAPQPAFEMESGDLVDTAWQLVSMDGADPVAGSTLTLAFHNDHRLSGHAGCRDYVASYQASRDDISLLSLAMIDAGCTMEDTLLQQDAVYTTLLEWASQVHLGKGWLEVLTARGETLVFEPLPEEANAPLEGKPWVLTALVEERHEEGIHVPLAMPSRPVAGTEVTAHFEDGTVSGSAGCNTYSAPYDIDGAPLTLRRLAVTKRACSGPPGIIEQEARVLDLLREVTGHHLHHNQLWLETASGEALVFSTEPEEEGRDCTGPGAFPKHEAELIQPSLVRLDPDQAAPGDQVQVQGTGGHLYWDNECGTFYLESARDFPLLLDGEPVGTLTCYAGGCRATLDLPADLSPGAHRLSVEGGSSLDLIVIEP